MKASIVLAGALAAALPALAPAQMYKWVDEKGVTHYSESPPPSGKSQPVPIKPRADPAPVPVPIKPSAATAPSNAVKAAPPKAGASRPPQPTKEPPAETPGQAELRRLSGEWKTAPGQAVTFSLTITTWGDSVFLDFVRKDWKVANINGRVSYDFTGANGQGRFSVSSQPSDDWDVRMTPTRIDYRLRGDALEASVTSSIFAGSYTLRK
jgi:hypothetical protein